MVILLATPPTTPFVEDGVVQQHKWVGWDGSVWSLHDGTQGVALEDRGLVGLGDPPMTKFYSEARAVPGARIRGVRAGVRPVRWPVIAIADSRVAADYQAIQDAFFNSIHPVKAGTWTVTTGHVVRSLRLTGRYDGDAGFLHDPLLFRWSQHDVTLEATQPYWEGAQVTAGPFSTGDPVDFIDEGGAPDFHVSASSTFSTAKVTNPGDVEAYPVWEVRGPLENVSVTVDGKTISVPFAVPDGERLCINTDPRDLSVRMGGADYRRQLGFQQYAPVPAKSTSSLTIAAAGAGSVSLKLTPLYFRAF
jgi:hypothetical protein